MFRTEIGRTVVDEGADLLLGLWKEINPRFNRRWNQGIFLGHLEDWTLHEPKVV